MVTYIRLLTGKNNTNITLFNVDTGALAEPANNLINKLSSGAGWIFLPKGRKKDKIDGHNYLIEQIKNNDNLSDIEKAAYIR